MVHLDEVTFLKVGGFGLKGRVVTSDFVGRDTGGESYALFHLLLSINFSKFSFEFLITELTEFSNGGTSNTLSDDSFEDG
mgnify:CR=1 FL=1